MPSGRPPVLAAVAGSVVLVVLVVLGALAVTGAVPALDGGAPTATPTTGARAPAYGSRSSASAAPTPLTLVALGDSVPAAATCDCTGYVEGVGSRLETLTGRPWVVRNDATGGWTTSDVADDLSAPATKDDLADADLVVVEVGANDFDLGRVDDPDCFPAATSACWSATLAGLRGGLTRIIAAVRRDDRRPDVRVAVLGYWNVTVDGAVGHALGEDFVLGSDELTRTVNATVAAVADDTGAVYVDAYTPLKGEDGTRDPTGDLLDDGDHPDASGHVLLTTAVVDALEDAGAVAGWRVG